MACPGHTGPNVVKFLSMAMTPALIDCWRWTEKFVRVAEIFSALLRQAVKADDVAKYAPRRSGVENRVQRPERQQSDHWDPEQSAARAGPAPDRRSAAGLIAAKEELQNFYRLD